MAGVAWPFATTNCDDAIHAFLNFRAIIIRRIESRVMDTTSLISAFIGAQTGMLQLAVAARLARTDDQSGSLVTKLIDAAQQSFAPLANVPADIGTNLDVSA
jgi:hypothetical protein